MLANLIIVGIIGRLNTGKDTIAHVFTEQHFLKRSFADPLKEVVQQLFDIPDKVLWGPSENRTGEVRQMLQEFGTDYARKFRPNIWVDKMKYYLDTRASSTITRVVIPDVRFINEAEMLHAKGAYLLHVTRPNHGSQQTDDANIHKSETESSKIPQHLIYRTIDNSGTLLDLQRTADEILKEILDDASRK